MTKSKKAKKRVVKVNDNFDSMCREIAKYIKFHGGSVIVIGNINIRKRPPLMHNFTFEIDFTGYAPTYKL
jgi:hypothetical protein